MKKALSILTLGFLFTALVGCRGRGDILSGDSTNSEENVNLQLLSFSDTSQKENNRGAKSVKKTANVMDEEKLVRIDHSDASIEAVVRNEQRDSFVDMVLYLSYLNTQVVFNEGNGEYQCASTTVFDDGMWVTKINLNLKLSFDADYYCYIEVKEITFLHNGNAHMQASLNSREVSTLEYGYVGSSIFYSDLSVFIVDNIKYRYISENELEVVGVEDQMVSTIIIPNEIVSENYDGTYSVPVKSIGNSAFKGCTSLTNVTIPESIASIGDEAFRQCTSLSNITIPNSVKSIGWFSFLGCNSIKNIAIPESVTSIGELAFGDCTSLANVTIGNGVMSIDMAAFNGCSSLESITIGDGVKSISSFVFEGCISLNRVNITNISNWCQISFSTYASNPLYYAHNLFLNGSLVTALDIPAVASIENYAFYGCDCLESVSIPESITSIGDLSFYDCVSLTDVTYYGTIAQWNRVSLGSDWNHNCPFTVIHCSDGDITL